MKLSRDFREFIESLNASDVRYRPVNFIDRENLKRNKQASGRLQDLADLENLG